MDTQEPLPFEFLVANVSMLEDVSKMTPVESDELLHVGLPFMPPPPCLRATGSEEDVFRPFIYTEKSIRKSTRASKSRRKSTKALKSRVEGLEEGTPVQTTTMTRAQISLIPRCVYPSDFAGKLTLWSTTHLMNGPRFDDGHSKREATGLPSWPVDYFCQWIPAKSRICGVAAARRRLSLQETLESSPAPGFGNFWDDPDKAMLEEPTPWDMMLWKTCIYQLEKDFPTEINVRNMEEDGRFSSSEINLINLDMRETEKSVGQLGLSLLLGDENFLIHVEDYRFTVYSFDEDNPLANEDEIYHVLRVDRAIDRRERRLDSTKAPRHWVL
jgi:hypothetical protein